MRCSSCGASVKAKAWICPVCDYILDPSVFEPSKNPELERLASTLEAPTTPPGTRNDLNRSFVEGRGDAASTFLGDVGIPESEFALLPGPPTPAEDRTSSFVSYATRSATRVVRRDAVPRLKSRTNPLPRTPAEDFLLSCIDGIRTVRQIQHDSGLAAQEFVVTLLTMVDKGLLDIRTEDGPLGAAAPAFEQTCEDKTEPVFEMPFPEKQAPRPRDAENPPVGSKGLGRATVATRFDDASRSLEPSSELSLIDFDVADDSELDDVWSDAPSIRLNPSAFERASGSAGSSQTSVAPIRGTRGGPEPSDRPGKVAMPPPGESAPFLDPAFLQEVREPTPPPNKTTFVPRFVGPPPNVRAVSAPVPTPRTGRPAEEAGRPTTGRRAGTGRTPKTARGPIQEKLRFMGSGPLSMADRERVQRSRKKQVAQAVLANPADSVRMMKAQKLFEQALRDRADGNLMSARMNMKLALTFDSSNELYREAFEELTRTHANELAGPQRVSKSRARELYDKATDAENLGEFDEAIDFLERAILESKQPTVYNRLGVLLATRRQEYSRAQELIEKALELSPGNKVYEQNLQKILARAATDDVVMRGSGEKKGGLLGFLGRRK